jgi:hypothetical protein
MFFLGLNFFLIGWVLTLVHNAAEVVFNDSATMMMPEKVIGPLLTA